MSTPREFSKRVLQISSPREFSTGVLQECSSNEFSKRVPQMSSQSVLQMSSPRELSKRVPQERSPKSSPREFSKRVPPSFPLTSLSAPADFMDNSESPTVTESEAFVRQNPRLHLQRKLTPGVTRSLPLRLCC